MKISRLVPLPPPEFTLTFNRDEGWAIVMALRDAYDTYKEAQDREKWLKCAVELDRELRK